MKIDVLANDGSPVGVSEASIHGEDGRLGVGGAELALLTLCKGWHDKGYKVTLYNDAAEGSVFNHRRMDEFSPFAPRDILVIFRSPTTRIRDGANGLKVWWSCDQRTIGNFAEFAGQVNKIVTISPFHSQYFANMYGIFNTIPIDLPVRVWEYDLNTEKIPYKCIWNSIPDRGALELAQVWREVVKEVPQATLTITSDWRLWDSRVPIDLLNPYRAAFASLPNVQYLGAIPRRELIKHELESQIHINPNTYEELFCIAVAETQVAGAYPISSTTGALATTNMGKAIEGSPHNDSWKKECVDATIELLQNQKQLYRLSNKVQHAALHRFDLDTILKQWDERVFS